MSTLLIKGQNVLVAGKLQSASILINKSTGIITNVHLGVDDNHEFDEVIDAGNLLVLPGLVDAHVHLNDPGRQTWETFSTGTLAALKGGITTLVDMPLNSIPPTTTIDNLHTKIQSAKGNLFVDTGFYGGVIPGNSEHLSALIEGGVRGFKCFMIESGVEEFPMCEESDIRLAMEKLGPFSSKTFLMFHAELAPCCDSSGQDKRLYETFLQTRPRSMENSAIDLVIKLCEEFQSVPCHIVHLSSADAIDSIKRAKSKGLPLTVETCFHYLALDAEQVPKGATHFKCCPPIRERSNREKLWEALQDGTIDYVVSDHSPAEASLKCFETGDFIKAWGGVSSLQLGLSIIWTEARQRGVGIEKVSQWVSKNPSVRVGLEGRKGEIAVGCDADIIFFDPDASFTVSAEELLYKVKISPYVGKQLFGVVRKVFLGGHCADLDRPNSNEPTGKMLLF